MTEDRAKFLEAMAFHLLAFNRFIRTMAVGTRVDTGPWIGAAQAAYKEAGGLDAYRKAVRMQHSINPDWNTQDEMARRMATALFIREGGMEANLAAAKAYIAAVGSDPIIAKDRKVLRARRQVDKCLLKAVRCHAAMCREVSYSETLNMIANSYGTGGKMPHIAEDMAEVARAELFASLGFSDEMWEVIKSVKGS